MASFSPRGSSGTATPARVSYTGTELTANRAPSPTSQASPSNRNQPRTLSDKYQLGEELGRGAYGLVFKGIDTRTGDCVAIKQLSLAGISAESLHSIMGEIDLLKNLNHKNIVKYIGSFKTRTHLYIILEFMENGALSNIIKPTKFGAFPESLVAVYIAQVLQGLAYLHDQGVVHRDIKGANILTTKEGLVKLADFGVAARLSELEADRDKSRLSVVGTPYWMAPEVIEMTSTTPASDIWSVGCLAIELLTGQPPYFDLQPMSALFRIVQDEGPEIPSDLSGDMSEFLQQCFHKDPQRRPTARQLLRHRWVTYNRQTLRSSWSRTQGMKSRGQRTDAHVSVSTVVERILQAEADEFAASAAAAAQGKPLPAVPEGQSKPAAQIPMNQSRATPEEWSREPSLDRQTTQIAEAPAYGAATDPVAEIPAGAAEATAQPASASEAPRPEAANERQSLENPNSRLSSRVNSLRLQPHGGLLEPLFRIGGPGMQGPGEDLLLWLRQKESSRGPDTAKFGEDLIDGAVNKHQEVVELRRLITAMRSAYGRAKATPGGAAHPAARTAAAVEAGNALLALFREDSDRIDGFLAEDGGVAMIELLQEPASEQVALVVLQLLNELATMDTRALGAASLLGAVPIVAQYAAGQGAPELRSGALRLEAALFLQQLAQLNLITAQLLIASQGLPVLVGLIEPSFKEHGPLVHVGVECIWRLLELNGVASLQQICRLLAVAGLASKLVHALKSATAQARIKDAKRRAAAKPESVSGLETQAAERTSSHSQASSRAARETLLPIQEVGLAKLLSVGGRSNLGTSSFDKLDATEGLHALIEKMGHLLLVMAHADTAVKATLCQADTLKTLFSAIETAPETLQLTALKVIKYLSTDPSMLEALKDASTIESLGRYLNAALSLPIQVEALHALHNLCKISRQRQEGAAKAGMVPYLMALAQMSPGKAASEPLQEELRQMAVSLLCGMANSTQLTRSYLWSNNGLYTLLDLLREEDWQGPALDALAAWLAEDPGRIEPRLTQRAPVEGFVQLFAFYQSQGGSDELARLLDPFLRILRRSPQITVEVAVAGLAGIVVEMLRTASALTALSLLQMVKVIYEHHPRPKEFVAKYAITDRLRELSRHQESSVLVNKQATHLLHAFQINSVF